MKKLISPILVLIIVTACSPSPQKQEQACSEAQIKQLRIDFQKHWIAGDSAAVMNLMAEDVVFMPHHGDPMIFGKGNLASYWFDPSYPPTVVTRFESNFEGVHCDGNLGYSYGRFWLEYTYNDRLYANEGNFLNTAKRVDGQWKIAQIIFNDPAPVVTNLN